MVKDVFRNSIFALPKIESYEISFPHFLKEYLRCYVETLNKYRFEPKLVKEVEDIIKCLLRSLFEYGQGRSKPAYDYISSLLIQINVENYIQPLSQLEFYRARIQREAEKIDETHMFHIPFEKRYKVNTERYSYPGLPCLYFASSQELCRIEMNASDNIITARFTRNPTNRSRIFNLAAHTDVLFNEISDEECILFLRLWPLIAACSFSCDSKLDKDKIKYHAEYVIPQLVLQYITDLNSKTLEIDNNVIGIRYYTTQKPYIENWINGGDIKSNINYVFPAMQDKEIGNSDILEETFKFQCFV